MIRFGLNLLTCLTLSLKIFFIPWEACKYQDGSCFLQWNQKTRKAEPDPFKSRTVCSLFHPDVLPLRYKYSDFEIYREEPKDHQGWDKPKMENKVPQPPKDEPFFDRFENRINRDHIPAENLIGIRSR